MSKLYEMEARIQSFHAIRRYSQTLKEKINKVVVKSIMLYRAEFLPIKNFHVQKNENWKDEDIWYGYVIRIRRDKIKNEDIWDKIRMVLTEHKMHKSDWDGSNMCRKDTQIPHLKIWEIDCGMF